MEQFCASQHIALLHKPLEERQSVITEPLRMPLHSEHSLMFVTLYCLNHAVERPRSYLEAFARRSHSLMVERVDE